jgi:hypothetical protein
MSKGSLTFLMVKGALLAAVPALAAPDIGPHIFAVTVLVLTLAGVLILRKRCG